jgi:hypothetical protein
MVKRRWTGHTIKEAPRYWRRFWYRYEGETLEDAVAHFVRSALKTRVRYGGKSWKPEEVLA